MNAFSEISTAPLSFPHLFQDWCPALEGAAQGGAAQDPPAVARLEKEREEEAEEGRGAAGQDSQETLSKSDEHEDLSFSEVVVAGVNWSNNLSQWP